MPGRPARMDTVKEWCKQVRQMGVLVGVGTHIPEVIAKVEEENWDVDFSRRLRVQPAAQTREGVEESAGAGK